MGIYRINPTTHEKFKRGDLSNDGKKIFHAYRTSHIKKDGYYAERWLSLDKFEKEKKRLLKYQQNQFAKNRSEKLPKRLNPETGQLFMPGDRDNNGHFFIGYQPGGKTYQGFMGEKWASTKNIWIRARIHNSLAKIKIRAAKKNIPINIDVDYLFEIFPLENMRCPILDTEMDFGGDSINSPSVDRLLPELGYIKGNVVWVSKLANIVKRELTVYQLRRIADWIEEQPIYKKYHN